MTKIWKLFPTLSAPMSFHMTLDRLLYESHRSNVQAPILRIFYSSTPWITVGYAAEKRAGYALQKSKHAVENIPVCRRITGGGTVVHGKDLIFSFFARKQDDASRFDSVETSYRHLHEVVKLAFQKLGKKTEFYEEEGTSRGRDCFLDPVKTDLRFDSRKVAGGAQKRSEDVFLHEESIQPPETVNLDDLEQKLILSFEEYFGVKMERSEIDPEILWNAETQADSCLVTPALSENKL